MKRLGPGQQLCPNCGKRPIVADGDWCAPCAEDRHTAAKSDWWHRQGDYPALLATGLCPRDAAARWLAHQLRRGHLIASRELQRRATRAGIRPKTLRRAREQLQDQGRLEVVRRKQPRGGSAWRRPPPPRA